jgi:hypothetical protein
MSGMTDENEPIELPAPKPDPGNQATDDHVAAPTPRGDTQPTDGLDPNVADEHLRSPSQGVRPETPPADEG